MFDFFSISGVPASGVSNLPRLGLVIGTYGAAPFIHLHLKLRQHLYPYLPVLVHDDASPEGAELQLLCRGYGADFISAQTRGGHYPGDLRAFARGLEWADAKNLDILVKFSRRFVPLYDWTGELQRLLYAYPFPTASNYDSVYGLGFRTECMAMVVKAWISGGTDRPSALDDIRQREHDGQVGFLEAWMHNLARRVFEEYLRAEFEVPGLSRARLEADLRMDPRHPSVNAYAIWALGGTSRSGLRPDSLWHEMTGSSERYAALARALALPYGPDDFERSQTRKGS